MRASEAEKQAQLANLRAFQRAPRGRARRRRSRGCSEVARGGGNVFAELMETVKVASLGQISDALFEVGGRYRRLDVSRAATRCGCDAAAGRPALPEPRRR